MNKKFFVEKLNSEKGVAAVMVLAVILMLTVLGTVALAASAVNINMSSKSKQWTAVYYSLDSQAEQYVEQVDNELRSAELMARQYIQKGYCKLSSSSTSFGAISTSAGLDPLFQDIIYSGYFSKWCVSTLPPAPAGYELKDTEYYISSGLYSSEAVARDAYKDDVKTFESELFDRVYFYYVSKKLNALITTVPVITNRTSIVLKDTTLPNSPGQPASSPCTKKFTDYTSKTWLTYAPQNDDLSVYIYVDNADVSASDIKKVEVKTNITVPKYETILQYIDVPFRGNPIWTNAIAAQGGVEVSPGRNVNIEGDLFASTGGLQSTSNAEINIYGNVYTAGDVHISGDNGKINIFRNGSGVNTDYNAKNMIYNGNSLFFDDSITMGVPITNYTERTTIPEAMPFIFKDYSNWGNVYCNKLSVDEGVLAGASIKIQGNLIAVSDIQMDGQHSEMVIGAMSGGAIVSHCIGLKSDSDDNQDPNKSSSIANNHPFEDDGVTRNSSITINSALFVPGVAFYEFDQGGPAWSQPVAEGPFYYKSAESITSRITSPTAIFDAYYAEEGSDFISPAYLRSDAKYYLTTPSGLNMLSDLGTYITLAGGVKTNIINSSLPPESYVLGAALIQSGESVNATVRLGIGNFSDAAYTGYNDLKSTGTLMNIFNAKTVGLGVANSEVPFGQFVNKPFDASASGLAYYSADTILNISGPTNGIIYCAGNLTITGNGVFNGTIICEGKLTLDGDVTIKYNEEVIISKLRNNTSVRKFFDTPTGSVGQIIDHATDYGTTSGTRTQIKRYQVFSWKESQK